MLTFGEFLQQNRIEGLRKMRNDTVFLCGQCRQLAYEAEEIKDRWRCHTCGQPVMMISHEHGRRVLAKVARDGLQPDPKLVVCTLGNSPRVVREINRFAE